MMTFIVTKYFQIQEPTFAKCVRSTISTVKQFNLQSFRTILPKFLDCTQEIVQAKCGDSPIRVSFFPCNCKYSFQIQVMRAMSSPNLCPIGVVPIVPINANVNANANVNSNRQPVKVEPKVCIFLNNKLCRYELKLVPFYLF